MSVKCPHCHDEAVLEGKIYNQPDYINPPAYFRPDKIAFFQIFNSNVHLGNNFFACSCCGFIWSKIDSQKLQRFITSRTNSYDI
ncbi:MAG: hypothetical protein ABIC68_08055 [Candidatus Omnitrophota bacterium]